MSNLSIMTKEQQIQLYGCAMRKDHVYVLWFMLKSTCDLIQLLLLLFVETAFGDQSLKGAAEGLLLAGFRRMIPKVITQV